MNPAIVFSKLVRRAAAESEVRVVVVLLLLPVTSWAGGTVTNCTEAALRAALTGGGLVTFARDGTIALTQTITNETDTVIDATGHQVSLSGANGVSLFYVGNPIRLTLRNLTLANGWSDRGGGAIYSVAATINATNCTFSGNATSLSATWPWPSGPPMRGGAIRNENGRLNLDHCLFISNVAVGPPGGLANYPWGMVGLPGVDGSGGAIDNSGTGCVVACTFLQNRVSGGPAGDMQVGFVAGSGGGAGRGGAIYNQGTLTVESSSFSDNHASGGNGGTAGPGPTGPNTGAGSGGPGGPGSGGAIFNDGTLNLSGSTLASNYCAGGAGGQGGYGGAFTFPDGSIGAPGGAGGAGGSGYAGALYNNGSAGLVNTTLCWNTGSGGSGGSGGAGGSGYIDGHSNYGPNGSSGQGGSGIGAFYASGGQCNITNCTIAFNAGDRVINAGSLVNTLLATNSPQNGAGSLIDLGHNLSSDASCSFSGTGSLNSTDPRLGPLAANGGATLTMALLPGSPAIDAGDSAAAPAIDQRGLRRPAGAAADIGAFEFGVVFPTLTISLAAKNGLALVAHGDPGQTCRLLASTNLSSWVTVSTNRFAANGTTIFQADRDPSVTCKFYRLSTP